MPLKNINDNNTIIYKLVCNDVNIKDCYVGHTTDYARRKQQHKTCCNNENGKSYNLNVYSFIRDTGGWDNWDMVIIEKYNCSNNLEAKQKERYFIEQLQATLNSNIPSRTNQENKKIYYNENKDKIQEKTKVYYNENKDKLLEQQKEYRKTKYNCVCGSVCGIRYKHRHFRSLKHQKYIKNINIPDNIPENEPRAIIT